MNAEPYDDAEAKGGDGFGALLSQLPLILWQRRRIILIPAVVGLVLAVAIAFLLPRKYESEAVLLVQAPSLPQVVIGTGADDAIAQRIESIRQQIINRPALIALIEKNGLYQSERSSEPLSKIVEDMREAITLVPQSFDTGSPGNQDATIAVRLAYYYDEPTKAQAVTQQLMEKIVEVDSVTNSEQLTGAVQFLTDQQQDLQRKISEAEGALAGFNSRYGSVIASGSMAAIGGGGAAYDLQISSLRREISDLEASRRALGTAETRDPAVVQAEAALAGARAVYAEGHPDVTLAKQRLEQARAFAKDNVARLPTQEIDTRINLARNQIAQIEAAKGSESAQTAAVMSQRAAAPGVQQQAAQLQQRVTTLYKQFEEISNRLLAARASARADEEQLGQRLLVVDPPVVPDSPVSPNRPLIIGIGAAASLVLGLLLALGVDVFLRPIRSPGTLADLTGTRPMAIIPEIAAPPMLRRSGNPRKTRRLWARLSRRSKKIADDEYLQA